MLGTILIRKQSNQLMLGALAFLAMMLIANALHESGHAAACVMYGGSPHTDLFSFVGCEGVVMANPLSLMAIRLAGGLVAAGITTATAILVLGSRISSSVKDPLLFAAVAASLAHLQMAFLEPFANGLYTSISSGVLYVVGAGIAVPVCHYAIERDFCLTKV